MRARPRGRTDPNLLPLAALALVLLVFLLWPYAQHGYRFPLGSDAAVYLWWTRLAGIDGLSAAGERPGIPALTLALTGVLRLPLVAVTAGLETALGAATGLGAAALVRERAGLAERAEWALAKPGPDRDRPEWLLAGALAGVFSVHLVAGYTSNLAFAVTFLAAGATLARGNRRGAIAAAGLLAGGGLSHPYFFLIGLAILAIAAIPSLAGRRDAPWPDTEAGRVGIAILGSGAIVGLGLLAMFAGPSPPDVETSKDGLLRRAGLVGALRDAYRERFLQRWARYVQWVSIPLAVVGLPEARGFVGRFLRSWGLVTIVGVVVGLATAWFPPDRFATFGYVVPVLAALGLARLTRGLATRRALAALVAVVLGAVMVLGAAIAWERQEPFISRQEVVQVTAAGRYASGAPARAPLAFSVVGGNETGTFLAARAGNVIRAALPPDRIRDAHVVFVVEPPQDGGLPGAETRALEALSQREIAALFERSDPPELFALDAFTRGSEVVTRGLAFDKVAPGVRVAAPAPEPVAEPVEPLEPTSPGGIALASVAVLVLIALVGYGWARTVFGPGMAAAATAPAFGTAALTLTAMLLDRLALPLDGTTGPWIATLLGGGGGYLVALVLQSRAVAQSPA